MDKTHIHLLITHLPIVGAFLGACVLAYAIRKASVPTLNAAYSILVLSAVGAVISYLTGEPAEETVEHLQGVLHDSIEEHEDAAFFALVFMSLTGLLSIGGLVTLSKNMAAAGRIATITVIVSFFSFIVVARTGYLGGQIRHTEVSSVSSTTNKPVDKEPEEQEHR